MSQQFHQELLLHLPRLRAYALSLTRNSSDADDLVQNTALLALKAESQFTIGTNFAGWAYLIMRNSFLSSCRAGKRRTVCIDDAPPDTLICRDDVEDRILVREALTVVNKLSPGLRDVLTLVCGKGLSYEETSVELSCSIGTVKSRLWRARGHMKAFLQGGDKTLSRESVPTFA